MHCGHNLQNTVVVVSVLCNFQWWGRLPCAIVITNIIANLAVNLNSANHEIPFHCVLVAVWVFEAPFRGATILHILNSSCREATCIIFGFECRCIRVEIVDMLSISVLFNTNPVHVSCRCHGLCCSVVVCSGVGLFILIINLQNKEVCEVNRCWNRILVILEPLANYLNLTIGDEFRLNELVILVGVKPLVWVWSSSLSCCLAKGWNLHCVKSPVMTTGNISKLSSKCFFKLLLLDCLEFAQVVIARARGVECHCACCYRQHSAKVNDFIHNLYCY